MLRVTYAPCSLTSVRMQVNSERNVRAVCHRSLVAVLDNATTDFQQCQLQRVRASVRERNSPSQASGLVGVSRPGNLPVEGKVPLAKLLDVGGAIPQRNLQQMREPVQYTSGSCR